MSYAVLSNADASTQYRGMIVKSNTAGTCVLAKADSPPNASDLLGVRLADVAPAASGQVAGLSCGTVVRLAGAAAAGDVIYLSASAAGVGTNARPSLAVPLGYAYNTYSNGGVWYAEIIALGVDQPALLSQLADDAHSTNQTDWVAIGSLLHLKPGRYKIEAMLQFVADAAAGIEVNLTPGGGLTTDTTSFSVGEIYQSTPTVAVASLTTIDPMFGSGKFSATGPTAGYAKITGIANVTVEGDLGWTFRQKVTNASATTVYMNAYFRAVRD